MKMKDSKAKRRMKGNTAQQCGTGLVPRQTRVVGITNKEGRLTLRAFEGWDTVPPASTGFPPANLRFLRFIHQHRTVLPVRIVAEAAPVPRRRLERGRQRRGFERKSSKIVL
jgi:hypothetical protein